MRESSGRELSVGLFVLAALAAIAWLSLTVGGVSFAGPGGLELVARFDEIGGLKKRAQVVVGGVRVGEVKAIDLGDDYRPLVRVEVDGDLELPADTSASILTSGVLGDQYIELELGGEPDTLQSGDEIQFTQSAVVLERLIGKLVQNLGGDEKE